MDQTSINHHARKGIELLKEDLEDKIDELETDIKSYSEKIFREYARLILTERIDDSDERKHRQSVIESELNSFQWSLKDKISDLNYHQEILENLDNIRPEDFAGVEKYLD